MRQPADVFPKSVEVVAVSDLTKPVEWRALLKDVTTVVHLAGIAHSSTELAERVYDRVNRLATSELASAAHRGSIRRLVFVSSIRAQTGPAARQILRETDSPHPTDAYGRSKLAAEDAVRASSVPFTILRPVLVYGSGVKGNMRRLLEVSRSPWPLPFGLFRQQRSLLARQNLVEAIRFASRSPQTAGETYIVSDPSPLTLGEIIAAMRRGQGRSPGLLPIPVSLIGLGLKATRRTEQWERLGSSLVVDAGKLLQAGWRPTVETNAGLAAMARDDE
jgi:UDP-glucose 4-epimerase